MIWCVLSDESASLRINAACSDSVSFASKYLIIIIYKPYFVSTVGIDRVAVGMGHERN